MVNLENLQKDVDMSKNTTFKLGGPAEFFLDVQTKEELIEAVNWAKDNNINIHFIGGGSNLLINDKGIKGLVIRLANTTLALRGERLECGAGLLLAKAASTSIGHSLSGLEWSVGIPRATIGGAIRGNAGAFGSVICEITETVEVYDTKKMSFITLSNKDCRFSYRTSLFKEDTRYIIWSATLKMVTKKIEIIKERMQEVADFRLNNYPKLPSAGSVFENLTKDMVKECNEQLYQRALEDKAFRGEKIGAGYIIDQCGLRGKKIGGIKISLEHANHIVNTGSGTADEVIQLIGYIKQQVRDRFGILLKEEVQYLGFDN